MNITINDEIRAVLTTDHPTAFHGIPVVVIDSVPYGAGDLISRGYTRIVPDMGITPETERHMIRYLSSMPGILWCRRCGNLWYRRTERPGLCPNCGSRRWDSPRTGNEPGPKPKHQL